VACNGRGVDCESCHGSGVFQIAGCPKEVVTRDAIDACKYVKIAEKHLPLAGGILDQTQSFLDAYEWITAEGKKWEAESGV
jgi:hypothetical protein